MKKISIFIVFLIWSSTSWCQINILSLSGVPDSLKSKMDAVVLKSHQEFNVTSIDNAIYSVKQTFVILNKRGAHLAHETLFYDDKVKIKHFKGTAYNVFGKKLKDINKASMTDQSAVSNGTIYSDNRVKIADLTQNKYPYFVDIEYELQFKSLFYIPNFRVLTGWDESVVQSSYSIISPTDILPNYKIINGVPLATAKENNGITTITFNLDTIKGISYEPYSKGLQDINPTVIFSAAKFSYDEYSGDMSTWEDYGKWQLLLNEGRDDLSVSTINNINNLVSNAQTIEEKSKIVYEYVQNKTRYVSIQLGIGGWQPFPASTVDELGYGDCKALSNYTKSLLNAVGVKSHYTIVDAGANPRPLFDDFAYNAFNHVILCVPTESDTVWLECTSQTNPFGYSGSFTGDRDVLLVNEGGGKIVHTPIYDKEDNTQITTTEVIVNPNGSAAITTKIKYSGLRSDRLRGIINEGNEEQKKWVYKNTQISDFMIQSLHLDYDKKKIPEITQTMEIEIFKMASSSGKRLFIQPNVLHKLSKIPEKNENRQFDLYFENEYSYQDSVTFTLPENYHVEFTPEPVSLDTPFGKYSNEIFVESDKMILVRKLELNKGTFDKSQYNEYRNFQKAIVRADKAKVVLVDKT